MEWDRWMVGFSPGHHRVARGTVRLVSWETRQLRARQVRSAQWDWRDWTSQHQKICDLHLSRYPDCMHIVHILLYTVIYTGFQSIWLYILYIYIVFQ